MSDVEIVVYPGSLARRKFLSWQKILRAIVYCVLYLLLFILYLLLLSYIFYFLHCICYFLHYIWYFLHYICYFMYCICYFLLNMSRITHFIRLNWSVRIPRFRRKYFNFRRASQKGKNYFQVCCLYLT